MAMLSTTAFLVGCSDKADLKNNLSTKNLPNLKLKMVTSFPRNLPGADIPAQMLAKKIKNMSQGKIDVVHYAAGELVPAFEVFDAVRKIL